MSTVPLVKTEFDKLIEQKFDEPKDVKPTFVRSTVKTSGPVVKTKKVIVPDPVEEVDENAKIISIVIENSEYSDVKVKVKETTFLHKLLLVYEDRIDADPRGSMKFVYDGRPVGRFDSARSLKMENGDKLEAFKNQFGG